MRINPNSNFRIAIISGIHGDERCGPIAISQWISKKKYSKDISYLIFPLINDLGWKKNKRRWKNIDLNRHFDSSAPRFLKKIMSLIKKHRPDVFFDFHESDETYPFIITDGKSSIIEGFCKILQIRQEVCCNKALYPGSSEDYAREIGCKHAATIEIPANWKLNKKIKFCNKLLNQISTLSKIYSASNEYY